MSTLGFALPDGSKATVVVSELLNGGYAGRSQDDVAAHVAELGKLGVPAPTTTPALYPVAPYLAMQTGEVPTQHDRTSGEAEWALVITGPRPEDALLTVACDHTDRALEVHGVAWSKQAGPDVLGTRAWRLVDVEDHIDELTLTAWADETEIQRGTLAELLPPRFWLDLLDERGLRRPGTVLLSGTIPMHKGVNQFASSWRVSLTDPKTGQAVECAYRVRPMPDPIELSKPRRP
jgi:hypothetical protein